ncbi:MAG: hypothetical protein ABEI98_02535 [Halorhabdus sp.]
MSSRGQQGGSSDIATKKLGSAMQEVARYRRDYIRSRQLPNRQATDGLIRGFHSAVINLYSELRPYRDVDALGNKWRNAKMWRDDNGEWVRGVDTLANWIDREVTVEESQPGRGGGSDTVTVAAHLSGPQLLRASWILDEIGRELGIQVSLNTRRPTGRVGREEMWDE